jgi:deoxyxylulose-5-phosphate synthase
MTYPLARPATPPLDAASCHADPRRLPDSALARLAHEVRAETIFAVSGAGGHSGAGLGVVELTVAIHAVFDTPRDKLIFDVGHQCHPHEILTGRRDRIRTLRQGGGLSGFTKRSESEHDPFGAAHGSTSISAGLGFAAARDLGARDVGDAVRVIGDGAMTAGLAHEAMNDAGDMDSRLLVILNDNDMAIASPVGALSTCLAGLRTERPALEMRKAAEAATDLPPEPFRTGARRARELVRGMARRGTPFEELGFTYLGPADGPTHAGGFDGAYLSCLPNMVAMAASDEAELARMLSTSLAYDAGPSAPRYPRAEGTGVAVPLRPAPLEIGRVVKEGGRIAILSPGAPDRGAGGGGGAGRAGPAVHRGGCALRQAARAQSDLAPCARA